MVGVDRAFLRKTLFEGVEEVTVFGAQVSGYALQEDGVVARFADGTTSPVRSLLLGADGVRSALTRQLTKRALKVYDTGARMIHGSSPRIVLVITEIRPASRVHELREGVAPAQHQGFEEDDLALGSGACG